MSDERIEAAEAEVVAEALYGMVDALSLTHARIAIAALDRFRDARIEALLQGGRGTMEAIGEYLAMYPPSGFADRYSAEGWTHIARGVLSAAEVFSVRTFQRMSCTMRDRAAPTHILRIEVPLELDDAPRSYDPIQMVLQIALSASRAAFDGYICDNPQVTVGDAKPPLG